MNDTINVTVLCLLLITIIACIITINTCETYDEPFYETIHTEIPPDLIQLMLSFAERRELICDIIKCTDLVYLEKLNKSTGDQEMKRFAYQKDGSQLYLWTGYSKQYYDMITKDIKAFDYDPYVVNNLTPIVQVTSDGKTKLLSASLADFIRFVGTYSYDDLMTNKQLTIKDERPNVLLKLLQLDPISYHEFMKRRQYIIDRGIM